VHQVREQPGTTRRKWVNDECVCVCVCVCVCGVVSERVTTWGADDDMRVLSPLNKRHRLDPKRLSEAKLVQPLSKVLELALHKRIHRTQVASPLGASAVLIRVWWWWPQRRRSSQTVVSDAVCHQHVAARWKRWTVNNSWQHESIGAAGDKQATGYSIGNRQTRQLLFEWIGCAADMCRPHRHDPHTIAHWHELSLCSSGRFESKTSLEYVRRGGRGCMPASALTDQASPRLQSSP
jgi:hypothetical protein